MRSGELASFHCGRARRIPVAALHEYVARQLAANEGKWQQIKPAPPSRRVKRRG
jgi:hypothetical protein